MARRSWCRPRPMRRTSSPSWRLARISPRWRGNRSKDGTSASGGDLGFVRRDALGPEVGAVLFALRPGEVTPYPVRTAAGWFVLRAEARRPGATPTFTEAHDRLQAECERDNVAAVVRSALNGISVRAYDMNGH